MDTYNIATTTQDEEYFVPVYVMLYSLFENNKDSRFNIFVFYKTLNTDSKEQLASLCKKYGHLLQWMQMNDSNIESHYTSAYLTVATYYRIYMPKFMPANIDKVLFLDADIIVRKNIRQLLDTDMADYPVMAVKEAIPYKIERLNIHPPYDYFNAGVLLFNIDKWRTENYHEQLVAHIEEKKSQYLMFDQDALNELFYKYVGFLDPQWNHQTGYYHMSIPALEKRYAKNSSLILNDPAIIHYTTQYKPWHYICSHPFKQLFIEYLNQTPFKDFAEKETFDLWLKKTGMRIKHKLQKIF